MKVTIIAAGLVVLTAGCAGSYERRIENRLAAVGMPRASAGCMAGQMVDRLSRRQLKQLANFGKDIRKDAEKLTARDALRRFEAIGDPEIVEVVTRAAIGCVIVGT